MSSSKPIFGHHSEMKITSILLFFLVPAFIFMFGSIVGEDYEDVLKYFSRPWPAIITSLPIAIGLQHSHSRAQALIDDYIPRSAPKSPTLFVKSVSYFLMVVGLYAIARMAF